MHAQHQDLRYVVECEFFIMCAKLLCKFKIPQKKCFGQFVVFWLSSVNLLSDHFPYIHALDIDQNSVKSCSFFNPFLFSTLYGLERARVKEINDWKDWLMGKATITSVFHLIKVLRSLRHFLLAQSQGYPSIDPLEERGKKAAVVSNIPQKDKIRPLLIRPVFNSFKGNILKTWEMGWSICWFPSVHRYCLELCLYWRTLTNKKTLHLQGIEAWSC